MLAVPVVAAGIIVATAQPSYAAPTATTIVATPATVEVGGAVDLTVTVTPAPNPVGTVDITMDGSLVGDDVVLDAAGAATVSVTAPATPGSVPLEASYGGDGGTLDPSEGTRTLNVTAATTTDLVASPTTVVTGQHVTLTATVAAVSGSAGTPTGDVTFSGLAGTDQTVALSAGVATLTAPVVGTVTAAFVGTGGYTDSTDTAPVTVAAAATATTLVWSGTVPVTGANGTLMATVTRTEAGTGNPVDGTVTFDGPSISSVSAPVNASGVATLPATGLDFGAYTATYDGGTGFSSSPESNEIAVAPAATTTVLTWSGPSPVTGENATLVATVTPVAPGTGSPEGGTVTFTGPGLTSATDATHAAGVATFAATAVSGTYTATFGGNNTGYSPSLVSNTLTVGAAATATVLTASPNPAPPGQSVTLTAAVTVQSPGSGTAAGDVVFKDPGGATLATVALNGSGQATHPSTTLVSGNYTAEYLGNASYSTSTSPPAAVTIAAVNTSTAVVVDTATSLVGDPVTVTATVTSAAGTPTGSVTFSWPGGIDQTVALNGSGVAALTTSALPAGSNTITATYLGVSGSYITSNDTVIATVNLRDVTVTMAASPLTVIKGENVTMTATVVSNPSGGPTPTGKVRFVGPMMFMQEVDLVAGVATLTAPPNLSGSHSASYLGDAAYNAAPFADSETIMVNLADTTTVVTASSNPSGAGDIVTLTATVAAVAPGAGVPTGDVTFSGLGGSAQTVPVNGIGVATVSVTTLASGTVTAVYAGDAGYNTSTGTLDVTVILASTTAVVATPSMPVTGQPVTLTATVTAAPPGSGTPTGSVTFTAPGGGVIATVTLAGGTAQTTTSTLTSGMVTATYSGDVLFAASSPGTTTVTIGPAGTTTAAAALPASPVMGDPVTVTATVAVVAPGTGIPTGNVVFSGLGGPDQTVALAGGSAAAVTSALPAGSNTVTATYTGGSGFSPSSNTATVTVARKASTTSVTATPNPSATGQSVTLTATVAPVAPGVGTPTGTVLFSGLGGSDQSRPVTGGVATVSVTTLASGAVTAAYSGDAAYNPSTGSVPVTVLLATTTAVTASPTTALTGQPVTLTATVTGPGTPTGVVTFTQPGGLNQAAIVAGGVATLTTTVLGTGTVTATYSGDATLASSAGTVAVTVNAASTTVTLATNASRATASQPVTFTATVTAVAPATGVATGTVNLTSGVTAIGSATLNASGVATFTTASQPLGTRSITAAFAGDARYLASTSAPVTQQVVPDQVVVEVLPIIRNEANGRLQLRAEVRAVSPGTANPTGTVAFYVNGVHVGTAGAHSMAVLEVDDLGEGDVEVIVVFTPESPTFVAGVSAETTLAADPDAAGENSGTTGTTGTSGGVTLPLTGLPLVGLLVPVAGLWALGLGLVRLGRRRRVRS